MAVREEEMTKRIKDAVRQAQEAEVKVPPTARFKGMALEAAKRRLERNRREVLAFLAIATLLVSAMWVLLNISAPAFLLLQGILLLAGTGIVAAFSIRSLLAAHRDARDKAIAPDRRL